MIGRKDMKQETMAKRVRNRAMQQKMVSPRKKMDMGMSPGPDMGADSMAPMAMKKGGMAKKNVVGTGSSPAAAKADYKKKMGMKAGGMAKKGMKKGGMMLIIGIGKKKGK
jgi:hypothetical protein